MKSKRLISAFLAGLMAVSTVSAMAEDIIIIDDQPAQEQTDTYTDDTIISEDIIITDEQTPTEDEMISEEIPEIQPEQEETEPIEEISSTEDEPEIETMTTKAAMEIVERGTCGENLKWSLTDKGTLIIAGTGDMKEYDIVIEESPWYKLNLLEKIKKVTVKEGVTRIGSGAFAGCTNLTTVNIEDGLTSIGYDAFRGCTSLTSVTMPGSVTELGFYLFDGCKKLEEINYSGTKKQWNALCKKTMLSYTERIIMVHCSNGDIGGNTYTHYCGENAMWEMISGGVLHIYGEGDLFDYFPGDAIYVPTMPWYVYDGKIKKVVIDEGVTGIGDYAFAGCDAAAISLPDSITSIGRGAFEYCVISSVKLGNNVTSIGEWAFHQCSNLTSFTMPSSVTSIGNSAFWGCSGLTSITVPAGVTKIDEWAFCGCTNLHTVSLPKKLKSIGQNAFSDCAYIETVKYKGTKQNWIDNVKVGKNNYELEDAGITCTDGALLAYGTCGTNANWQMDEKYVVTISGSGKMSAFAPKRMEQKMDEYESKLSFVIKKGIAVIDGFEFGPHHIEITDSSSLTKIGDTALEWSSDSKKKGDIFFSGSEETWKKLIKNNVNKKTYKEHYTMHYGDEKGVQLTSDNVTLSKTKFVYNGKVQNPSVTVKVGKKTLTQDKDYTRIRSKKKSAGAAEITVVGLGKYYGNITKQFSIVPNSTELTDVVAEAASFTAAWKQQTEQTTGYELQYTRNKEFTNAVSKRISGNTKVSCDITGLESGKTYYVRIRTYKKEKNKEARYYSKWSDYVKVKTK